jgi:hypothetical protein
MNLVLIILTGICSWGIIIGLFFLIIKIAEFFKRTQK